MIRFRSHMRRLSHDEIRRPLLIQLTVQPPYVKRVIGINAEHTVAALADLIMLRIFSGTVTVAPSLLTGEHRPGRFGVRLG